MSPRPMDPAERGELLAEYARCSRLLERAEMEWAEPRPTPADVDLARERLAAVCARYAEGLPRLRVSRCPFTGDVLRTSIDAIGLDGLWWNSEAPVRPDEERPATFFALAGAVDLRAGVPTTDFTVRPGPEVAWVVPRLLALPSVRAVVSAIEIGGARACVVAYFALVAPRDAERIDDWGRDEYAVPVEGSAAGWAHVEDVPSDYDFELAPWIRSGRVHWIAPGDRTLTLRGTVDDCPFLALPGRREPVWVRRGRVIPVFSDATDGDEP